jgi:hypothetical protein
MEILLAHFGFNSSFGWPLSMTAFRFCSVEGDEGNVLPFHIFQRATKRQKEFRVRFRFRPERRPWGRLMGMMRGRKVLCVYVVITGKRFEVVNCVPISWTLKRATRVIHDGDGGGSKS